MTSAIASSTRSTPSGNETGTAVGFRSWRPALQAATSKALGTGIRGIRWREMEILPNPRGKPILVLHGGAKARADHLGLVAFDVSLTHSRTDAMAVVVAVKSANQSSSATNEGE